MKFREKVKLFWKQCCKSSSISDVARFTTHVKTCLARNQINLPTNRAHSFPRAQIKARVRNFLCYRGQSERESSTGTGNERRRALRKFGNQVSA